jgi:hypothetical protein
MSWIPWIRIEEDNSPNPEVQNLYKQTKNPSNKQVSDTVKLNSLIPEVSILLHELSQSISKNATGLTMREKEMSALIIAVYNGCVH